MLLTNNHLTPVVGLDIHFTTLPPFNPFHPYIGIIVDPMDYIPFIGTNVHINGKKRGVSDTSGIIIPLVHIPLFTPPWLMAPIIGHESMNFFASEKVFADGTRLSPKGHMLMTCNDIGIPLSLQPGKKKFWKVLPTLFAPTSYSLPIPSGSPVNVGGPYPPDWAGMLTGLAMSFGFGAIMNLGRKAFNKLLKKGLGPNKLSRALCHAGFEPLNLVNGAVFYEGTDFTLPGTIPLEWKRAWYSDSAYQGMLGHGCHFNYDLNVELMPEEEAIALRADDGRVLAFPMIQAGEEFFLRQEKITLKRNEHSFEALHHDTQLTYFFEYTQDRVCFKLTRIKNTAGFSLDFSYKSGLLFEITDTADRKLQLYYNDKNLLLRVCLKTANIQEEEILVEYRYNDFGDMTSIIDSLGKATLIEYHNHLMVKKTDRNGQAFYWKYDGTQTGARCIHTKGDGGWQEGFIEYFPEKGFNKVTNACAESSFYYYTPQQLVTQIKDPLGNSKFFHYTDFMEPFREIDEEGNITGYTYDERGNRTTTVYPDGTEEVFMYDELGRLSLTINPEGQKRSYVYREDNGLLNSIIEPDDSFTVFEYNEQNLLSEVRKNGESVYLEYDSQHNLTTFKDSKQITTQWNYDRKGNVSSVLNAAGNPQHFQYDTLGRVTAINTPDNVTELTYNAYEEVIEAKDKQHLVRFAYTPLGSLAVREQDGVKVSFAYDKMERLKEIVNEKEEYYRFSRNGRGDITQETGFDSSVFRYDRDRAGKIIQINRPGGKFTIYEYNLNGQVIRSEHSDGTWETYTYNKNGLLSEARNLDNCIKLIRDKAGRIIEENFSTGLPEDKGHSVYSTYDENGNRTQIKSTLGAEVNNVFDYRGNILELEALQKTEQTESGVWKAEFKRNMLGQEIERTLSGGIKLFQEYDEKGRQVLQKVRTHNRETYNREYTWNANHKLTQTLNAITKGTVQYAYDALGSLASAKYEDGSHDYKLPDKVGNLYKTEDQKQQIYSKGGRLIKDENWWYTYDPEGNLILKTKRKQQENIPEQNSKSSKMSFWIDDREKEKEKETKKFSFWVDDRKSEVRKGKYDNEFDQKAEIRKYSKSELKAYDKLRQEKQQTQTDNQKWMPGDWQYEWQGNGMLKAVKDPEGKRIEFEYDALGRRSAKIVYNFPFEGKLRNIIYRYLWEGNVLLHEWSYLKSEKPEVIADELGILILDTPEPVKNLITWIYEDGSFVPTAKIVGERKYSIISDYLGRPIQVYNEKGELGWETEYDIYGNLRNLQGNRNFIPFRQLGQYEDVETGLYYNRFRYYNPEIGSYISKDPIGLAGNNPNFYAYVFDSNTMVDPLGLDLYDHLFHGEINRRGKAVGFHHQGAMDLQEISRVTQITVPPNDLGVYKAKIEVFNTNSGNWIPKGPESTFFPKEMSRVEVLTSIDEAFANKTMLSSTKWEGTANNGMKIGGYIDSSGNIATAFPKIECV